ncbi:MAG: sulfotransferase [Cyanobacteria bacterium P01_H01_bin.35]
MMKLESKTRLFLVGCPRSGTTLLQSMLAAHPQILSFPETKFFWYLIPLYKERWRRKLKMVSQDFKPRLKEFFVEEINQGELLKKFSKFNFLRSQYTRQFINILDELTVSQGKTIWLEKTPEHLLYIDYIEKNVPGVKFIHLLRNGTDVVASLHEVTQKYPEPWGGDCWDLNLCIRRWVEAVEISRQHIHKSNHILVRYEDVVTNTEAELVKLCQFIGINFTDSMLENYRNASEKLTLENAGRTVKQEITNRQSEKFQKLFNESERDYIIKKLSKVDLSWVINN